MRTLIISYDLAQPHRNKHILAHHIMAIGNSWARPLEQTWYVRTDAREEEIEAQLRGALDPDDGLLIQATRDGAALVPPAARRHRHRRRFQRPRLPDAEALYRRPAGAATSRSVLSSLSLR
jgi:hypothetical protein